jgi:hypothetical protein
MQMPVQRKACQSFQEVTKIVRIKRRKIRLIESNAKCRYRKNLPVKGICGWCFICLRPPPNDPIVPPPHTVHVDAVYLFTQGRGGRANQRQG